MRDARDALKSPHEVAVDLDPIHPARLIAGFSLASTHSDVAPSAKQGHLDVISILKTVAAKSSVGNQLKLLTDC